MFENEKSYSVLAIRREFRVPTAIGKASEQFDTIVVGGGSAGCVLANRRSVNPSVKLLLLEAGGNDLSPWLHIPAGYIKTVHNPRYDECCLTEPDPGIADRRLQWPRGKVLGGSNCQDQVSACRALDHDRVKRTRCIITYPPAITLGSHSTSCGKINSRMRPMS